MTPPTKYRPDIDGLRAVAVLSVLGYHLGLAAMQGGFVGVDVFFVISGYLISSIILRDIDADRFSIVAFYERRIRRVFPAMLAMFLVVTVVSCALFVPPELVSYAQSLIAALFSGSNLLFWHQGGYFDTAAKSKPLLHTWSLSVEEQFYLVFPPFLLLLRRLSLKARRFTIVLVALASFLAALVTAAGEHSSAAFYSSPLRAWELLIGTVLAQRYLPPFKSPFLRHASSLIGLSLILVPIFAYKESLPFSAAAVLPPCLGTALLIASSEKSPSIVGRVLALKPVAFMGLISYSVYLWHWPLIVFNATDSIIVPMAYRGKHIVAPSICLLSILMGYLSWRFVEQPFRVGGLRLTRKTLFGAAAAAVSLLAVMAVFLVSSKGLASRYPPDARAMAARLTRSVPDTERVDTCFITPNIDFSRYDRTTCLNQHSGVHSVLLLGDSHAARLYPGLVQALPQWDVLQANASACLPLLEEPETQSAECKQLFNFIFNNFLLTHSVDTVVLAGRWTALSVNPLQTTVLWAHRHGIQVVVAGPNPEFNAPLARLLAKSLKKASPEADVYAYLNPEQGKTDRLLASLRGTPWDAPYVSYFESFCKPACPLDVAPRIPTSDDGTHLSPEAGAVYAQTIVDLIRSQAGPSREALR